MITKQLILQWRKRRKHEWYKDHWIPDDESSLSNKEIRKLLMEVK